jgi:ribosomal protein S18 acetylase RimI-like enzyme
VRSRREKFIDMNILMNGEFAIEYRRSPRVSNEKLNELFEAAWENHTHFEFLPVLAKSLGYVCAFHMQKLVGFVFMATDGAQHAFILDTTVHPDYRRRGIGVQIVKEAVEIAHEAGVDWVHVDFDPHLQTFYDKCGFRHTPAGVIKVESGKR